MNSGHEDDRRAFLEAAGRYVSPGSTSDLANVLDELISWSESNPRLRFDRNQGKQSVVRYVFSDTGDVCWVAYPRTVDGAKLVVLPNERRAIPESLRELLRTAFKPMARREDNGVNGVPTVSMESLCVRENLNNFLHLLATVSE